MWDVKKKTQLRDRGECGSRQDGAQMSLAGSGYSTSFQNVNSKNVTFRCPLAEYIS